MSAVADPPRADPGTHCPRCGAELAPEQDWCVECGTAARTRIVPPPSWRGPVAIVAVLLVLAAAGVALAFVEVTDQGQQPASTAAARSASPAAPKTTATAGAKAVTPPSTAPAAAAPKATTPAPSTPAAKAPALLTWPKGKAGYTVVLLSTADHATARKTAKALAKAGPVIGLARSADFSNVPAGSWFVFAGRYQDHAKATAAAVAAKQHGATGAYVQYLAAR